MPKTMCPGQDTAFWRPGDVYEIPCSACGNEVEFFKDDASRRCTKCGQLMRNPKLNLGCAQWCEHAKECLGYDPKDVMAKAEGGDSSLIDKLIAELKRLSGADEQMFSRALKVMEKAKTLLSNEQGSPRVVLTAALMGALDVPQAKQAMKDVGLDEDTKDRVLDLLAGENSRHPQEAAILHDAGILAAGGPGTGWLTESGKILAQQTAAG